MAMVLPKRENAPPTPSQYPEASAWWPRASQSQRLAQLDGGIEVGLTAPQMAMVLGGNPNGIRQFAWLHGRKIGRGGNNARLAAVQDLYRAKRAFIRGEYVDFFGADDVAPDEFRLEELGA